MLGNASFKWCETFCCTNSWEIGFLTLLYYICVQHLKLAQNCSIGRYWPHSALTKLIRSCPIQPFFGHIRDFPLNPAIHFFLRWSILFWLWNAVHLNFFEFRIQKNTKGIFHSLGLISIHLFSFYSFWILFILVQRE